MSHRIAYHREKIGLRHPSGVSAGTDAAYKTNRTHVTYSTYVTHVSHGTNAIYKTTLDIAYPWIHLLPLTSP
jgi:hypothetical protein